MSNLDPTILGQGPDPRRSLAEAILAVLGGGERTPVLSQSAPGALFENPIRLEELTVIGTPTRPIAPDAANQIAPALSMHGMPFIPGMQAQQRSDPPEPQRVFARRGILPQMEASDPDRAEALYEAIYPAGYTSEQPTSATRRISPTEMDTQSRAYRAARAIAGLPNSPRIRANHRREDAWRLYLGLPQRAGTFSVSQFRPSDSREAGATYLSIPNFLHDLSVSMGLEPDQTVKYLIDFVNKNGKDGRATKLDAASAVMGNYTLSIGQDERGPYVSYYDKWDINPRQQIPGAEGRVSTAVANRVGRPFEIYDRIYFDPETFQPQFNPRSRGAVR